MLIRSITNSPPLFHVVFSSESCLKNFLLEIGDVKHLMEVELLSILSEYLKTESPQLLTTIVQLDLFLVSPNRHEAGEADVHQVTAENCSTFVTHWKDSKLFNFASLHWEGSKFQISDTIILTKFYLKRGYRGME